MILGLSKHGAYWKIALRLGDKMMLAWEFWGKLSFDKHICATRMTRMEIQITNRQPAIFDMYVSHGVASEKAMFVALISPPVWS